MFKLKDIKVGWIIHIFALLHAIVTLLCRHAGVNDELLLTVLTMAMVLLICMKRWMNIEFAAACVIMANVLWALVIPKFRNIKTAYVVSLLVGAAGFATVFFIHDQYLLFISFLLIGVAWAAMLAIPFTLLTNSLSGDHIGTYLGLFNGTICLPQIVAAACGGLILKLAGGAQVNMFIVAGIFLVLGAASVYFVKTRK